MIRVLLADDHPVFLAGLNALLDTVDGIEIVGSAHDGTTLIALSRATEFDVAVIDLDMPGADGAMATEEILQSRPGAAVLILTMHDDTASLTRCLRAGARGYILKGAGHGAIARAIAAVADGDTLIAGSLGHSARNALATQSLSGDDGLTVREREVLALVRDGLDNPEIARRLRVSVKTVQNNVSALLTKLQVGSRVQLALRGARSAHRDEPR